jgi:hypothetical protein
VSFTFFCVPMLPVVQRWPGTGIEHATCRAPRYVSEPRSCLSWFFVREKNNEYRLLLWSSQWQTLARHQSQRCRRLAKGITVLHDNARPHSALAAGYVLGGWTWEVLPHPPYSLGISPCDFHLFEPLKERPEVQHKRRGHGSSAILVAQSAKRVLCYWNLQVTRKVDKCIAKQGQHTEKCERGLSCV